MCRNAGALHGSSPPGNSVGWLLGSSPPNGLMGTSPCSTSSSFGGHRDASTSGQTTCQVTCDFMAIPCQHVQERRHAPCCMLACRMASIDLSMWLPLLSCSLAGAAVRFCYECDSGLHGKVANLPCHTSHHRLYCAHKWLCLFCFLHFWHSRFSAFRGWRAGA